MGAIKKIKPNFFGSSPEKSSGGENTIPLSNVKDPESTLATVMLTRLYDKKVDTKFNRLMLMTQNDEVSSTYPLNRKITHVGRSRRNHVRINDPLVSTKHLTVGVSGNQCVINDLDSSNGTFVNGERMDECRVLKDGDEIMIGKTVLRFAARHPAVSELPGKAHLNPVVPLYKKRLGLIAAAIVCVLISAAFASLSTRTTSEGFAAKALPLAEEKQSSTHPTSEESATASQLQALPVQTAHIQIALAEYADGQLDSAKHTLKMLSTVEDFSPEGLQSESILSKIRTVQELHGQVLQAQEQQKFAKAIEYWDRLLIVDMELVGDRPSFYAKEAEQSVQMLSFEYALEALRSKNHKKAKQLCQAILQINPGNQDALALMSRIDPTA